jgi:hypothetical protein
MHHECMTYALQVCPYLAMPNYLGRLDTKTMDPAKVPPKVTMLVDQTMTPERPIVFVAIATEKWIEMDGPPQAIMARLRPAKPYRGIEFWKDGSRISDADGNALVELALKRPYEVREPRVIRIHPSS